MNRFVRRIKFILNVKRFLPFLVDFFRSKEVPLSHKVISILCIAGYAWFPFDAIPDFLVVLGIVDDFAILGLVLQFLVKLAPPSLQEKYHLK